MTGPITLPVGHTWDGLPAPDRALVQLASHPHGLLLRTCAPLAHDPPPAAPPGPTPRLWEHEVIELFLAGPDGRYLEVEIGPGGHHLVLLLDGVRHPVAQALPLRLRVRHFDLTTWTAEAILPAAWLPPLPWRANAFRIHGPPDDRRHLASTPLPGPHADFHQPDRFAPCAPPSRVRLITSVQAAAEALVGRAAHAAVSSRGPDQWARSLHATLRAVSPR